MIVSKKAFLYIPQSISSSLGQNDADMSHNTIGYPKDLKRLAKRSIVRFTNIVRLVVMAKPAGLTVTRGTIFRGKYIYPGLLANYIPCGASSHNQTQIVHEELKVTK